MVGQESFLLPDDHQAVTDYLECLEETQQERIEKLQEKEDKPQAWINLHMSVAEKRISAAVRYLRVVETLA